MSEKIEKKKIKNKPQGRVRITNEQKLKLMLEYMQVTGKEIIATTVYKGYNLGYMRTNLRVAYFNGTLNMNDELLEKFIQAGIIKEEKERLRFPSMEKSVEEYYEFLMATIGKSKKEVQEMRLRGKITYDVARSRLQTLYNTGMLNLPAEKIEILKENGFLLYSAPEKEKIVEKYSNLKGHLKKKNILEIERKYGSYEEFLKKLKKGECNYDFTSSTFVGYRGITLSEKDITQKEKLSYAELASEVVRLELSDKNYIDIDELNRAILELNPKFQQFLNEIFGLEGEKNTSLSYAKANNVTKQAVNQEKDRVLRKLREANLINPFVRNIQDERLKLKLYKCRLEDFEKQKIQNHSKMEMLKKVKEYIIGQNNKTTTKKTKLSETGIIDDSDDKNPLNAMTILDYILYASEEVKSMQNELNKKRDLELLDEISDRQLQFLRKRKIVTVFDLMNQDEESLKGISERIEVLKIIKELKKNNSFPELKLGNKNLAKRCDAILDRYLAYENCDIEEILGKKQIDALSERVQRYEKARENYFEEEDILNPDSIVLGVPRMQINQEQEDEKKALILSINNSITELAELKRQKSNTEKEENTK